VSLFLSESTEERIYEVGTLTTELGQELENIAINPIFCLQIMFLHKKYVFLIVIIQLRSFLRIYFKDNYICQVQITIYKYTNTMTPDIKNIKDYVLL